MSHSDHLVYNYWFLVYFYIFRSKLSSVNNSSPYHSGDLPAGVKVPQLVLASEPIPSGDIAFVSIYTYCP